VNSDITPRQLRKLREGLNLSISEAAELVRVSTRTWRSWETDFCNVSHRGINSLALEMLCLKVGIPYPPVREDLSLVTEGAKVLSITAYKGGVGKSPITVEAACCLAEQGYKVAVISNDGVFNVMLDKGYSPSYENPKYFREIDVLFSDHELRDLLHEVEKDELEYLKTEQTWFDKQLHSGWRKRFEAKQLARFRYSNLQKEFDYILLDFNYSFEQIAQLADLVVLVIDVGCGTSRLTLKSSVEELMRRFPDMTNRTRGLISNLCNFKITPEMEEVYVGLDNDIECVENLQDRNFTTAAEVGLPLLNSILSSSYKSKVSNYNKGKSIFEQFSYFDSVTQLYPDSVYCREIKVLVNELLQLTNLHHYKDRLEACVL